jgi:hypothetical protein
MQVTTFQRRHNEHKMNFKHTSVRLVVRGGLVTCITQFRNAIGQSLNSLFDTEDNGHYLSYWSPTKFVRKVNQVGFLFERCSSLRVIQCSTLNHSCEYVPTHSTKETPIPAA